MSDHVEGRLASPVGPRRPKAVDPLATMPSQEPQRSVEANRRILRDLFNLHRYESRAVTRRDRAIRAIAMRSSIFMIQFKIVYSGFLQNEPNLSSYLQVLGF